MRYISYNINAFIKKGYVMFNVEFYSAQDGKEPVSDFLDTLDQKMRAKMVSLLELLGEKGTSLRMPYSSYLEDGIFELRCTQGNNISRVLYFFYIDKQIVVTNGFIKKTQKTPRKEIELAKSRRSDWLRRHQITGR